jgi:hypothetical protein
MRGFLVLGVCSALAGGFGCGGQQGAAHEGSAAHAGTVASASGAGGAGAGGRESAVAGAGALGGAGASGATGKAGAAGVDAAGAAGVDAAGAAGVDGAGAAGGAGLAGASGAPGRCENDQERVEGSGYMACDNGLVHRPAPGACRAYVPSQETVPSSTVPDQDSCTSDADCTERPLGMCRFGLSNAYTPLEPNRCGYACIVDADCPGGICVCGETHGECRGASCTLDADCGPGLLCAEAEEICSNRISFSCQVPSSACQTDRDCMGIDCIVRQDGTRACQYMSCDG